MVARSQSIDSQDTPAPSYEFGRFTLHTCPLGLWRGDKRVELSTQPLRLLELLASRAGQIAGHEDIRRHVWGSLQVDFNSGIHVCIRQIRDALADNGGSREMIETVPRRGYRLVPEVDFSAAAGAPPSRSPAAPRSIWPVLLAVLVTIGALAGLFAIRPDPAPFALGLPTSYAEALSLIDQPDRSVVGAAAAYLEHTVAQQPDFAPGYVDLALARANLGDASGAITAAEKAVELDPTLIRARLTAAALHGELEGRWEPARAHLDAGLAIDPQKISTRLAQSRLLLMTGDADRVTALLDEIERSEALTPAELVALGQQRFRLLQLDAAGRACSLAAERASAAAVECLYQLARHARSEPLALEYATQLSTVRSASTTAVASTADFERAALDRLTRIKEPATWVAVARARHLAALGRFGEALLALFEARDDHSPQLAFALLDPVFIPLWHQQQFLAIAQGLGVTLPRG